MSQDPTRIVDSALIGLVALITVVGVSLQSTTPQPILASKIQTAMVTKPPAPPDPPAASLSVVTVTDNLMRRTPSETQNTQDALPKPTWQGNLRGCDEATQGIAAEPPFTCIEKPQPVVASPAARSSTSQAVPVHVPSGSHQDWLTAAGIPSSVWGCADELIRRESGWNIYAQNASSGALGIPQALPGEKMASAGADYRTNPMTQLRWMYGYVNARYGGFCQALQHSQAKGWP